jgi:glutathione S-transferase
MTSAETSLYFAGLYDRFATPAGWSCVSRDYFAHMRFPLRAIAPHLIRRGALRNLHGQGTGRLAASDVADLARRNADALATTLGRRPFFLGDEVHTVDASAFGLLWAISSNPFESAVRSAVERHVNLREYVARLRARYWPEYV